jgi:hypothetical protein
MPIFSRKSSKEPAERIVFCIDLHQTRGHFITIKEIYKAVHIYLNSKLKMEKQTSFALCGIMNQLILINPFLTDVGLFEKKLSEFLKSLSSHYVREIEKKNFEFESVMACIKDNPIFKSDAPTRMIFIYSRVYKPDSLIEREKIKQLQDLLVKPNFHIDFILAGSENIVNNLRHETRTRNKTENTDWLMPDSLDVSMEWFKAVLNPDVTGCYLLKATTVQEFYQKMMLLIASPHTRPQNSDLLVHRIGPNPPPQSNPVLQNTTSPSAPPPSDPSSHPISSKNREPNPSTTNLLQQAQTKQVIESIVSVSKKETVTPTNESTDDRTFPFSNSIHITKTTPPFIQPKDS